MKLHDLKNVQSLIFIPEIFIFHISYTCHNDLEFINNLQQQFV